MTSTYDRRLMRLENELGNVAGPCALLPKTMTSTAEWLERNRPGELPMGRFELGPVPRTGCVRDLIWVAEHE